MQLITQLAIQPMTSAAIARVAEFERHRMALPQVAIHTQHVLHAGMYARTITIPGGVMVTGAIIKRATTLVVSGDVLMSRGDDEGQRITGTAVIPAGAGRKQVFAAYADTTVTMIFPTGAKTVEEAETEFTDEADMLLSHRDPQTNSVIITGE